MKGSIETSSRETEYCLKWRWWRNVLIVGLEERMGYRLYQKEIILGYMGSRTKSLENEGCSLGEKGRQGLRWTSSGDFIFSRHYFFLSDKHRVYCMMLNYLTENKQHSKTSANNSQRFLHSQNVLTLISAQRRERRILVKAYLISQTLPQPSFG